MKFPKWHRQKNQQNKTTKYILHPFVDHEITIIIDGTLMDMFFGTKVVKITPIHIPNDYFTNNRVVDSFLMEFQGEEKSDRTESTPYQKNKSTIEDMLFRKRF